MEYLCSHLAPILERELANGNSVESVIEKAFERCDLFVILARPFSSYHEDYEIAPSVKVKRITDQHYAVGKSYFCSDDRDALFAPEEPRR